MSAYGHKVSITDVLTLSGLRSRIGACFDCPEASVPLRYVCAAPGRGGAITVARELSRAEGSNMATTAKSSPELEIEYRLWYIKEQLGKPRLSRQGKDELREEVAELEASLTRLMESLGDRLAAVADRMEKTLGEWRGGSSDAE
jgi:hypothetical protein